MIIALVPTVATGGVQLKGQREKLHEEKGVSLERVRSCEKNRRSRQRDRSPSPLHDRQEEEDLMVADCLMSDNFNIASSGKENV